MDIENKIPKGYFLTEFDLVNNTASPISYDLFNVNTLNVFSTQPSPVLPPSVFSTNITVGGVPSGIAYNPVSNSVYSVSANNTVSVIDCNSNTLIFTIIFPPATSPAGISYNTLSNTMYVTCSASDEVYVIDCSTNTIIGSAILVGLNPIGIAYNTLNNTMYVSNNSSGSVSVINCNTNTVIGLPISVGTDSEGIAYDSIDNRMYVCCPTDDNVAVINCVTNLVIANIPVTSQPLQIDYNTTSNTMYVANLGSSDVWVIDCSTNTVIGSPINVGTDPVGIEYNSLLNLMYVSNLSSSDISVINCSTNLVVNTIPIASTPSRRSIVFNFTDNTFYIGSFSPSIYVLSPISSTTSYIGGSFNYNQFIRDIQNNPVLVKDVMFYSSNQSNVNQVFFTAIKDATGLTILDPKYPQLSVSVNQMQNSISKVDFGENGFVLDVTNSFSGVTVAAQSTLKLILVLKQDKKAYYLSGEDLCSKLENVNKVQYVMGVDNRNNVIHLPVLNFNTKENK